jgi:glycosyltransferase involved in cell wall biosynthesis
VISVVVPAFNAGPTLPKCLSSLRGQTTPPDEIVVVDDGSTDGTVDVARSFGVGVVRQDHQGPAVARNNGAAHITGDILLYTDADCEPASDWVEQMVRPLGDPGVAGVKGAYRTRQREVVARLAQCEFEERYDRLARFPTIDFVDTYSAAFRLDAFRAAGGFDAAFPEANNEDVDLSYRLARAGHTLVFNRQAVVYHQHKADWQSYFRLKVRRGYWRMMVYRLHPGKAVHDSYTPQNLKAQIALLPLMVLLAIAGLALPRFWYASAACLALFCISGVSFARITWKRDPRLLPWVLPFLVTRAAAFVVGIASGLAGAVRFHGSTR